LSLCGLLAFGSLGVGRADTSDAAFQFALAKVLAADGSMKEADEAFQRALAGGPDQPLLHAEYARFLLQTGRKEEAVQQVDEARRLAPHDRDVLAAVAQVELEAVGAPSRSLTEALSALEALRQLPDPDPQAMVSLAQIYLQQGRNAAAADTLDALNDRLPGNPYVRSLLIEALMRSGRLEDAARQLQESLQNDPQDLRARLMLAEIQRRQDQPEDAVETLRGAPKDQREDVQLRRHLALALYLAGHVEEAKVELEAVRASDSQSSGDDFLYGSILSALGENEAALKVLQPLAAKRPVKLEQVEALAEVFSRLGEPERAAEAFDDAAAALENQGDARGARDARLGQLRALAHAESWDRIVRIARQQAKDADPSEKPQLMEVLVDGLHGSGRDDEALALLDRSPPPFPEPLVTVKRLRILHDEGATEEVEKRLDTLSSSGDATELAIAGRLRLEWGQRAPAIDLLEAALKLDDDSASTRYWLATAYQEAGREADAEALLRRLVQAQPDFAPALNFLGYLLAEGGRDLQEALSLTRRAVREDPANGAYVDSLGWAHFRLGELDLAKQFLERAARLIPNDATIYEHLGDLYTARGERDAARRVYHRALELKPDDAASLQRKLASLEPGS